MSEPRYFASGQTPLANALPALAAATWIFGLVANPESIHDQLNNLRGVLLQEAWQIIDTQLNTPFALSYII